jgi:hypothetical protein
MTRDLGRRDGGQPDKFDVLDTRPTPKSEVGFTMCTHQPQTLDAESSHHMP